MKKIGFIDYYLDEWHANNYPRMIAAASNGSMAVTGAFGLIDSPIGGRTTETWCREMNIPRFETIEALIADSDALIVLSPDNCEMHEQLCRLPLASGGTPCCSTSALRFADEYADIAPDAVQAISSWGPNGFETYSIHQLEPILMLIQSRPVCVMAHTAPDFTQMDIAFADGRFASLNCFGKGSPFMMNIAGKAENTLVKVESDFFHNFIVELVAFLRTGEIHVPHDQTLAIMAVRGAGLEAIQKPGVWVDVPAIS